MRRASQIQAVDVLEEQLGRTGGEEVVRGSLGRDGRRRWRLGRGIGRGDREQAKQRGSRFLGFGGRRRRFCGDLSRNATLQDEFSQAASRGRNGAARGEGVTQTEPTGGHWCAGAGPHGAGGVDKRRLGTWGDLCDVTWVQDATGGEGVGGESGALTLSRVLHRGSNCCRLVVRLAGCCGTSWNALC